MHITLLFHPVTESGPLTIIVAASVSWILDTKYMKFNPTQLQMSLEGLDLKPTTINKCERYKIAAVHPRRHRKQLYKLWWE